MVMSSHAISMMAAQQQAMFGNAANYAQQITPPGGMFGGYSAGPPPGPPQNPGFSAGYGGMMPQGGLMHMAAQLPYQMPGQYMSQGFAEQLGGGLMGMGSGAMSGASNLIAGATGLAGMATMGFGLGGMATGVGFGGGMAALGALPMGGAVMAAGGMGAMGVGGLAMGAAYAGDQVYQGFQQRQDVSRVMRQRFGGAMGVGGGRGGMGFSGEEMGQMSTMMRGMATEDMFTSFDELTRTLDKTSQMGLYRGVQSAEEFREKFKKTVDTLKEVAKTMNTSLDDAAGFMEQQRNQGFFSGQDINSSLMRTRLNAGASGMSIQQMDQIGQQGTMMGRSMGMRGRTGSDALKEMATNVGVAMQMGVLSDEDVAEATGGLTGAEGAQAFAARQMQTNRRWLKRGAGRVMLAGLWDKEGGIDEGMMQRAMSGDMTMHELRAQGRRNVAATGGRRSEFFLNEDRLGGELMAKGGGDLQMGLLARHIADKRGLEIESPIVQRLVQRQTGRDQSEVEASIKLFRNMPEILQERNVKNAQQTEMMGRTRAREGTGLSGLSRRIGQWWDQEVTGPLRQSGDDLQGSIEKGIDDIVDQMEGRIRTTMTERSRKAQIELRATGKGGLLGRTLSDDMRSITALRKKHAGLSTDGGFFAGLGRMLGTRTSSLEDQLAGTGADPSFYRNATDQQKISYLEHDSRNFARAQSEINLTETERARLETSVTETLVSAQQGGTWIGSFVDAVSGGSMSAADYRNAALERISILENEKKGSADFRARSEGMTEHQKFALLDRHSGGLSERFQIGSYSDRGTFGGSTTMAQLRGDMARLNEEEGIHLKGAQGYFSKIGEGMGLVAKRRGAGERRLPGDSSALTRALGLEKSIDVKGFVDLSREHEGIGDFVYTLANKKASDEERSAAISGLRRFGEGDTITGAEASAEVRGAAVAIARSASDDRETTEEQLGFFVEKEQLAATIAINETRIKEAEDLRKYLGTQSGRLGEIKDRAAVSAFEAMVKASENRNISHDEKNRLEDEFLMEHASGQAGADILGVLGSDPRAVHKVGMLSRMRRSVKDADRVSGIRDKGPRGDRARLEHMLGKQLGSVGLDGISAIGSKQEQRKWLANLQSGKSGVDDLLEHLKKQGDGELGLREGFTEGDLSSALGGVVGKVQKGAFGYKELTQEFADSAQRGAEGDRQRGDQKSMEDLPNLAQKQVASLERMVKLTETIAAHSGNKDLVDAINALDKPPGAQDPPAGGQTQ